MASLKRRKSLDDSRRNNSEKKIKWDNDDRTTMINHRSINVTSSKPIQTYSKLEMMPNELFYETFQYLSPCDIVYSFYGIGNRFNLLIKNTPMHIDFSSETITIKNFQYNCKSILPLIHNHVISLKLSNQNKVNAIKLFTNLFDIEKFENLQMLILVEPKDTDIQLIVSKLSKLLKLSTLRISSSDFNDYTFDLSIYRTVFEISTLKQCQLPIFQTINTFDIGQIQSYSIQNLVLDHCDINIFDKLLFVIPNIKSLTFNRNIPSINESTTIIIKSLELTLPTCTHLRLYVGYEQLEYVDHLLKNVCINLEKLTLWVDNFCCEQYYPIEAFYGEKFEYLLSRISETCKIELFITAHGFENNDIVEIDLNELYRTYQTDFWHQRYLYITIDYYSSKINENDNDQNHQREDEPKDRLFIYTTPVVADQIWDNTSYNCKTIQTLNPKDSYDTVKSLSIFVNENSNEQTLQEKRQYKNVEYLEFTVERPMTLDFLFQLNESIQFIKLKEVVFYNGCCVKYFLYELFKRSSNICSLTLYENKGLLLKIMNSNELCSKINQTIRTLSLDDGNMMTIDLSQKFVRQFSNIEIFECSFKTIDELKFVLLLLLEQMKKLIYLHVHYFPGENDQSTLKSDDIAIWLKDNATMFENRQFEIDTNYISVWS